MNTPSKAYVTKFSSGLVLALLAFSGLLILIPVATPVFASNASTPTISITSNNQVPGGALGITITMKVANPASNQFTVTGFSFVTPTGWTVTGCTPGGFLSTCTVGAGGGGVTWTVSTFFVGTGAGIPPGGSDVLSFTATAGSAPTSAATYPFTSAFTTKIQDASSVAFYNGPTFNIQVMDPHTAVVVTALTTPYVAGSAAQTVTATVTCGADQDTAVCPGTAGEPGLPVVWTAPGYAATTTYSFTPSTSTVGSAGTATSTFQPSNHAGDVTAVTATIGTSAVAGTSANTVTTVPGAPTEIAWTLTSAATDGNHYITTEGTTANGGGAVTAVTGAEMVNTGATYSIADKFGNPVSFSTAGLTWTVTITALSGAGVFDALGLPSVISCTNGGASWKSGSTTLTPAVACPSGAGAADLPFNYFQSATYDSIGELSAGVSGCLGAGCPGSGAFAGAGQSGQLITSTFAAASPVPVVFLTSAETAAGVTLPSVPAGDQVNVTATLGTVQAGVPVQLMLDQGTSFETLAGAMDYGASSKLTVGFSNGLTYITAITNANGQASALFTLDTLATPTAAHAFFLDNVTRPTDTASAASITFPTDTTHNSTDTAAAVVTIANTPATFTVLTYYDSTLTTPATHAATGASLYVDVTISDIYGNVAQNTELTAIQVTLSATAGTLSATTVYINHLASDTASSFGPITWTMPSAVGTASLTATGVLSGKSITSAPNTIGVVSPLPTLAIISPTPLSGVIYSKSNSVVFTGEANASIGYASTGVLAVKITSITYSIDGGAVQTAPTTSANQITFSVAATMTAGLHTIYFNATDSLGNVASSSKYSVLVDTSAPTVAFTTKTGAVINYTNSVTATITVPEGDLNATSVVATLNGTALASSHVTVTGTNNLGKSVTYTVTLSGLAAGSDTIGLSASSLAGLTGTATAITVTVQVAFATSVLITSATYGTLGSFNGISVTATNTWTTSQNLVVFAVWKNSAGQTAAVTTGGLTLASGATGTTFAPLAGPLTSGTYTVSVFVITTANNPVSSTTTTTASQ